MSCKLTAKRCHAPSCRAHTHARQKVSTAFFWRKVPSAGGGTTDFPSSFSSSGTSLVVMRDHAKAALELLGLAQDFLENLSLGPAPGKVLLLLFSSEPGSEKQRECNTWLPGSGGGYPRLT